jgi:hypothetical protein
MNAVAPTLHAFFTERLIGQRRASPKTIAAYRGALRLLLGFAAKRLHLQPSELDVGRARRRVDRYDPHSPGDRSRQPCQDSERKAGFDSLAPPLRGAPAPRARRRHPACPRDPAQRADRALVTFLELSEIDALIQAPDRSTWTGRRDRAAAAHRDPDRASCLRADRAELRRYAPRHRRSRHSDSPC